MNPTEELEVSFFSQVRHEVRNPWAHCNFQEWDLIKYQNSFQIMFQIVKSLQLPVAEETTVIGELVQWQTNGIFSHFVTLCL
jgi:hypothetical protein